jgi:hypothetical protein
MSGLRLHSTPPARALVAASLLLFLVACADGPYRVDLMPAPAVYQPGLLEPFGERADEVMRTRPGVFYATLRQAAGEADDRLFYNDERDQVLRLGRAKTRLVDGDMDWEEKKRISLSSERGRAYPIEVVEVEEFGILEESITEFLDPGLLPSDSAAGGRRFAAEINEALARSRYKDILIYVHGYRVRFEDPVLVALELWHFLGYEGAVVAFSWPATESRWAYFADTDTALASALGFRIFLNFLAEQTEARRIHVLGYSAGTRMVTAALHQLALMDPSGAIDGKLGKVVLVGGEVDRQLLGSYLVDGLLDQVEDLMVYVSETDQALSLANFLLFRPRAGQMWEPGSLSPSVADYLRRNERLEVINVTPAEGAAAGNGHGYFRSSPWASSDILTALRYGLDAAERGLVREDNSPEWAFPPDYVERLRRAVRSADPALTASGS